MCHSPLLFWRCYYSGFGGRKMCCSCRMPCLGNYTLARYYCATTWSHNISCIVEAKSLQEILFGEFHTTIRTLFSLYSSVCFQSCQGDGATIACTLVATGRVPRVSKCGVQHLSRWLQSRFRLEGRRHDSLSSFQGLCGAQAGVLWNAWGVRMLWGESREEKVETWPSSAGAYRVDLVRRQIR